MNYLYLDLSSISESEKESELSDLKSRSITSNHDPKFPLEIKIQGSDVSSLYNSRRVSGGGFQGSIGSAMPYMRNINGIRRHHSSKIQLIQSEEEEQKFPIVRLKEDGMESTDARAKSPKAKLHHEKVTVEQEIDCDAQFAQIVIIYSNTSPPESALERQALFKHKHHSEPVSFSDQLSVDDESDLLSEDEEYHDDELRDAVLIREGPNLEEDKSVDQEDRAADYSQNDVDEYTVSQHQSSQNITYSYEHLKPFKSGMDSNNRQNFLQQDFLTTESGTFEWRSKRKLPDGILRKQQEVAERMRDEMMAIRMKKKMSAEDKKSPHNRKQVPKISNSSPQGHICKLQ